MQIYIQAVDSGKVVSVFDRVMHKEVFHNFRGSGRWADLRPGCFARRRDRKYRRNEGRRGAAQRLSKDGLFAEKDEIVKISDGQD
ncbi:hypothetical protein PTKU46_83180 [Paraburkholderia terrae]